MYIHAIDGCSQMGLETHDLMQRRTQQLLAGTNQALCQICVGDYGQLGGVKLVAPFSTDQLSKLEKESKVKKRLQGSCQTCIFGKEGVLTKCLCDSE